MLLGCHKPRETADNEEERHWLIHNPFSTEKGVID
jgi:hypothetical protein